ncbi:hypothetical protein DMENIID0001_039120 [Sergentomyia squamirostris]
MPSGKLIIFAIMLGLMEVCSGKWCESTEETYVKVRKLVPITKLTNIPVKCNKNDPGKSCRKPSRITTKEYRTQFELRNETKSICCNGYMEELRECKPICENVCVHAICVEPNTCKCLSGYEIFSQEASYRCVPVCEDCEHGTCVKPNVCVCSSGYKMGLNGTIYTCIPDCYGPCPFGQICSEPNTCTPDENFSTTSTEISTPTELFTETSSTAFTEYYFTMETLEESLENSSEEYSDELDDDWKILKTNNSSNNETLAVPFNDKSNPFTTVYAVSIFVLLAVAILLCAIIGTFVYLVRKKHEYRIKEGPDHVITLKSLQ